LFFFLKKKGKNAVTGLRILHTEFKLSKRSVAVGLIVDKEDQNQTKFIEQIYPILNSKTGYNLQLVSILASEKMKLSKGNCKIDSLDINTEPSDLKKFINHLENFPSRHKYFFYFLSFFFFFLLSFFFPKKKKLFNS